MKFELNNQYNMMKGKYVILFIITAIVALIIIITFTVRTVSHHYDKANCHSYSVETNRKTKFVEYNYFQWKCFTPTSDGKWLPIENLREITG